MNDVPESLASLLDRIRSVLEADARVRAAWLTGSLARGQGDEHADVDVRVAVADEAFDEFVAGWERVVASVGPTVLRRRLPGPGPDAVFTMVTPDWRRWDLVAFSVSRVLERPGDPAEPLFDRDGLTDRLQPAPQERPPSPDRLAFLAEEFLRVLGLTPVVVGRGEYLVGTDGVWLLRRSLIELLIAERGATPPGGAKRLNPFLTDDQRALLEGLPPIAPTRQAILDGNRAIAGAFIPRARALLGERYPADLEAATLAHLERTLGFAL